MRTDLTLILRQLAQLLLAVFALYGIVLGLTLLWVPPQAPAQAPAQGLDTGLAARSLYLTEPKYVFLGRGELEAPRPRIVLLGASNVVVGFRRTQLQALLPDAEVDNLGVGGSNVTQLRQILDLVYAVQSPQARREDTFVIGLWYGLFADDAQRWNTPDRHAGDTDIDIERYRYGFYRRGEQGPVALLPPAWLDIGVHLIHPWLVLDRATRDATASLRARLKDAPPLLTDAERNARSLSDADKAKYLAFWSDYMGGGDKVSPRQFAQLEAMIREMLAQGSRVVLVDLPLPAWHASHSPYTKDYERRLAKVLEAHVAQDRLTLVGMERRNADADFSDEVHPKPRVTPLWAQQLAGALSRQDDIRMLSANAVKTGVETGAGSDARNDAHHADVASK